MMYTKDFGYVFGEDIRSVLLESLMEFIKDQDFVEAPDFKPTLNPDIIEKSYNINTPLWVLSIEFHFHIPQNAIHLANMKQHQRLCGVFFIFRNKNEDFYFALSNAELEQIRCISMLDTRRERIRKYLNVILRHYAHKAVEENFDRFFKE